MNNGPTIPTKAFIPPFGEAPLAGRSMPWSVAVRRFGQPRVMWLEVWEPDDVQVNGESMPWYPAGDGSGVLYAHLVTEWGMTVAIARAVPLS